MALKIASLKFKGGVGSSSIVNTLASIFAETKKVLIVDLDPQNTQITLLNARGMADKNSSMSGVLNGGFDARKCVIEISQNLHLLQSGGKSIEAFNRKFESNKSGSTKLQESIEKIESDYDIILFDASPTISLLHQNIIIAADFIILPTELDVLSMSATRSMIHLIENTEAEMKKDSINVGKILGVIPTRYDKRRILDDQILEDLYRLEDQEFLGGGTVFNTLRDSANMKTAQARRKPLNIVYPKGNLTQDFLDLSKNILEQIKLRNEAPLIIPKIEANEMRAQ